MNITTVRSINSLHAGFLAAALLIGLSASSSILAQGNALLGTLIFESTTPGQDSTEPSGGIGEPGQSADTLPINTKNDNSEISGQAVGLYQSAIEQSIEDGELYSQDLAQQYEALGISLFRDQAFEEAIAAFEDAIHIHKVNKGLFNLDQARMIEHLIDVYTQLGDFPSVDNFKHYLYYIQVKNLEESDPRLTLAMQEWADWNIEAYTKGYRNTYISPMSFQESASVANRMNNNSVRIPFRIELTDAQTGGQQSGDTNPTAQGSITANLPMLNSNAVATNIAVTDYNIRSIPIALTQDLVVNQRLYDAENIYMDLLDQARENSPLDLIEQQKLQQKIANVNFLLKQELKLYETIDDQGSIAYNRVNQEFTSDATLMAERRYVQTKNNYETLVDEIESSTGTSATEKAQAYISLGDMHLSFDRPRRAFTAYSKAFEILTVSGISSSEAASMISPRPDIAVPEYGIHRYSRNFFNIADDVDIPFKGHIDVTYSKDRFGKASAINIVDSSESTPRAISSALVEYLRDQIFRPDIINGETVRSENIELRYYYYY